METTSLRSVWEAARHSRGRVILFALASGIVAALWIGVNASKPFHIDDPLFIYWARTISPLPGEVPQAYVNWEDFHEPLLNQVHPKGPGWSLLLTWTRRWWGDDEVRNHWLQWPFATMFLLGAAILAGRFGAPPWPTLLLCASSPLFLLPATSVMADTACLGPAVLGFALWLGAPSLPRQIAAGLLIALAGQMKQTVFPLLPLLFLEPSGRILRSPMRLAIAAGTCLLACYHPDLPPPKPTGGTILDHLLFIFTWSWGRGGFLAPKAGYALASFAAVAIFPAAFFIAAFIKRPLAQPFARLKAFLVAALLVMILSAWKFWQTVYFARGSFPAVPGDLNALWFYLSITVFLAWGLISLSPLQGERGGRGGEERWLLIWMLLVFAGNLLGTPFPAARFLQFSLPALAILLVLDLKKHLQPPAQRLSLGVVLAGNLWLSLSLAHNDVSFARFARESARRGAGEAAARNLPLWTTGQWGLRFYVEQQGGSVLGEFTESLKDGAFLLAPELTDHRFLPGHLKVRVRSEQIWEGPSPAGLRRLLPARPIPPRRTSASFHGGHVWLPYAFATGPVETIRAKEIAPLPVPSPL